MAGSMRGSLISKPGQADERMRSRCAANIMAREATKIRNKAD